MRASRAWASSRRRLASSSWARTLSPRVAQRLPGEPVHAGADQDAQEDHEGDADPEVGVGEAVPSSSHDPLGRRRARRPSAALAGQLADDRPGRVGGDAGAHWPWPRRAPWRCGPRPRRRLSASLASSAASVAATSAWALARGLGGHALGRGRGPGRSRPRRRRPGPRPRPSAAAPRRCRRRSCPRARRSCRRPAAHEQAHRTAASTTKMIRNQTIWPGHHWKSNCGRPPDRPAGAVRGLGLGRHAAIGSRLDLSMPNRMMKRHHEGEDAHGFGQRHAEEQHRSAGWRRPAGCGWRLAGSCRTGCPGRRRRRSCPWWRGPRRCSLAEVWKSTTDATEFIG